MKRKVLGVILNLILPGIGTAVVGKVRVGVSQAILFIIAAVLVIAAGPQPSPWLLHGLIGLLFALIVLIWSIGSVVTSPGGPR